MAKKETALTKAVKFDPPALIDESIGEAFQEEMEGLDLEFVNVRVPSGGGVVFEVPNDDDPDDPETTKELIGVIVDHHPVNACWKDEYTGEKNPPDCFSLDGKTGVGDPGGNCRTCPLGGDTKEAWESGIDGGKLCKNKHRIFLLREGEIFPLLIIAPVMSRKPLSAYLARSVISKGLRSYQVLTRITLKKATNKGGIEYSQLQFSSAGILDKESQEVMKDFVGGIRALTRTLEIVDDRDYGEDYVEAEASEVEATEVEATDDDVM